MSTQRNEMDGLDVDELLGLLGNRVRMQIMRVLWEEFDFEQYVIDNSVPLPFSEIFERTDSKDSGNFNYHLGQLTDTLIEQQDGGYVLLPLGYNLMRSIDSYSNFNYRTIDERPLDTPCPFCSDILVGSYERELLQVRCTNCDGLGGEGNLNFVQITAISAVDLGLRGLLDIAALQLSTRVRYSKDRICPECYTGLDTNVDICTDHTSDSNSECPACGGRYAAEIQVECDNCGFSGVGPLAEIAMLHPSVIHRLHSQDPRGTDESGPWHDRIELFRRLSEVITGVGPYQCSYTFEFEDPIDVTFTVTEAGQLDIG